MKTITIFCWTVIFLSSNNFLFSTVFPNYSLSVANQEVKGRDVHFDVFVQNTDTAQTIYLAKVDLYLSFNTQYFSNPTLSIIPAVGTKFADTNKYMITTIFRDQTPQIATNIYFAGMFTFQFLKPSQYIDSLVMKEINDKLEVLSVGKSVKIAHCIVSGISDTNGTFGLRWYIPNPKDLVGVSDIGGMFKSDKDDHSHPIGTWISQAIYAKDTSFFIQPPSLPLKLSLNSVGESIEEASSISLFPNPAFSSFVLRCAEQSEPVRVQVFTALGALVLDSKVSLSGGEAVVALPTGLADGVYTVLVETGKERQSLLLNVLR